MDVLTTTRKLQGLYAEREHARARLAYMHGKSADALRRQINDITLEIVKCSKALQKQKTGGNE